MAVLVLKYVVANYWSETKLRPNEKNTIRQIMLECISSLDLQISIHIVQ